MGSDYSVGGETLTLPSSSIINTVEDLELNPQIVDSDNAGRIILKFVGGSTPKIMAVKPLDGTQVSSGVDLSDVSVNYTMKGSYAGS